MPVITAPLPKTEISLSLLNGFLLITAVLSEIYLRPHLSLNPIDEKMVRYGLMLTPLACIAGIVSGWTLFVLSRIDESPREYGFFSKRHLKMLSTIAFILPITATIALVLLGII